MREAFTQTSDNEEDGYELSAMERDIMMATGVTPRKLKIRELAPLERVIEKSGSKSISLHQPINRPFNIFQPVTRTNDIMHLLTH